MATFHDRYIINHKSNRTHGSSNQTNNKCIMIQFHYERKNHPISTQNFFFFFFFFLVFLPNRKIEKLKPRIPFYITFLGKELPPLL